MFPIVLVVCALAAVGRCSVVHISPCQRVADSGPAPCEIKEVRIDACRTPNSKTCELKKGKEAGISFDFVPSFAASKLSTGVFWNNVAFNGLDSNACTYTTCPVEAGTQYTLNYKLLLHKKLPSGTYPVEWKVWDDSNKENECCFQTTLKLK